MDSLFVVTIQNIKLKIDQLINALRVQWISPGRAQTHPDGA